MKRTLSSVLVALLFCLSQAPGRAEDALTLTKEGVNCSVGDLGRFTLGIPALDGRNAHAAALADSVQTDGKVLTAQFGAPFEGVSLRMTVRDGDKVDYVYDGLPPDAHLVMCQFNLPNESITPGLAVTFDDKPPVEIPQQPGKTNEDVRLASLNARTMKIMWPGGVYLALTAPTLCWHGVQDTRVWGKKFVGVCLTPPLIRDTPAGNKSSFTLEFSFTPKGATPAVAQ